MPFSLSRPPPKCLRTDSRTSPGKLSSQELAGTRSALCAAAEALTAAGAPGWAPPADGAPLGSGVAEGVRALAEELAATRKRYLEEMRERRALHNKVLELKARGGTSSLSSSPPGERPFTRLIVRSFSSWRLRVPSPLLRALVLLCRAISACSRACARPKSQRRPPSPLSRAAERTSLSVRDSTSRSAPAQPAPHMPCPSCVAITTARHLMIQLITPHFVSHACRR